MIDDGEAIASLEGVTHRYRNVTALDAVTLALPAGRLVGLIGPDGVGKSTLLAIIAGARQIQSGNVDVLGSDMAQSGHRAEVCPRIALHAEGLGKNLYPDRVRVVQQHHGHYQQHHDAGDHPCRRRGRPGTGARHAGPPCWSCR